LSEQFQERLVEKVYRVLVHGRPGSSKTEEINLPIGRRRHHRRLEILSSGRAAQTLYRLVGTRGTVSLLEVHPLTGRTHQIRVHLHSIGCPVVGDGLYGRKALKGQEEAMRPMLHACRLGFIHPTRGKRVRFSSPVPPDFKSVWNR